MQLDPSADDHRPCQTHDVTLRTVEHADWNWKHEEEKQFLLKARITWPNKNARAGVIKLLGNHDQPTWPIVVLAHGGGFDGGGLRGLDGVARRLCMRGLVCINVAYRTPFSQARRVRLRRRSKKGDTDAGKVLDNRRFPAAVRDLKAAVRFARAEAASDGLLGTIGDVSRIGVFGSSSGATHMGVLAATDFDRIGALDVGGYDLEGKAEDGLKGEESSWSGESSRVDFAILNSTPDPDLAAQYRAAHRRDRTWGVGLAAYIGSNPNATRPDPDPWIAASPKTYLVHADGSAAETKDSSIPLPRIKFIHGAKDARADPERVTDFKKFIEVAGGDSELNLVSGWGHGTWSQRLSYMASQVTEFAYA